MSSDTLYETFAMAVSSFMLGALIVISANVLLSMYPVVTGPTNRVVSTVGDTSLLEKQFSDSEVNGALLYKRMVSSLDDVSSIRFISASGVTSDFTTESSIKAAALAFLSEAHVNYLVNSTVDSYGIVEYTVEELR